MTRNLARVILLVVVALATGHDVGADEEGGDAQHPRQVVAAEEGFRLSSRILFVIDVSGSMQHQNRLRDAVDSCMVILQAGVDEFRVGAIAFTADRIRWGGVPRCQREVKEVGPVEAMIGEPRLHACTDRCCPSGWADMPSAHREVVAWLGDLRARGDTNVSAALREAMEDPTDDLTIVLVTDGDFHASGGADPILEALAAGRARRIELGLNGAGVMVWGAGPKADEDEDLHAIARAGGGGLWVLSEQ